jgi:hypothetical protein
MIVYKKEPTNQKYTSKKSRKPKRPKGALLSLVQVR